MESRRNLLIWLLIIPVIAIFYISLFLTMHLWYPNGLPRDQWERHIFHFSIMFVLWTGIFYSYRLFDFEILRNYRSWLARLVVGLGFCAVIAAMYFYLQPQLSITPRRFLLVNILLSGIGVAFWYVFISSILPHGWQRFVFAHNMLPELSELESLIRSQSNSGFQYAGILPAIDKINSNQVNLVVLPTNLQIDSDISKKMFDLRMLGVRFIEYHKFYEKLTRTVHLSVLSELWFIYSVDYGSLKFFDLVKRVIDIFLALLGMAVSIVTFPFIALLIKLSSTGPVFFAQDRVGQQGKVFTLYKYRTMIHGSSSNTWTTPTDSRITMLGKFLRITRLDELPQSLNILKGDMSIVGPRPEQVNIVEQLREQIPYYDERHIVKPGLTGWAQLHVYASTLEETKHKLQYDLYYIKHRSLIFDLEIILKTIYNIISFSGR